MPETLIKIAWLAFVLTLTIYFKEPRYLYMLVLLPLIGRRKDAKRHVLNEFDSIHDRLDLMSKKINQLTIEKDKQP